MNEQQALKAVGAMLTDYSPVRVRVPAGQLLILQSALMLASRIVRAPVHQQMHKDMAVKVQKLLKTIYAYDFTRPFTQADLDAASKHEQGLMLETTYCGLYISVSSLHLMSRYPEAQPILFEILNLGYRFQNLISRRHPDGQEILEAGWNPENDR